MNYFGSYERFETLSKKDAALLIGADNPVGEIYQIETTLESGEHRALLVNRFDQCIGYLDPDISRKICQMTANHMHCEAILLFVAFTDHPDEGHYWGEVALICYPSSEKRIFNRYVQGISKLVGEGLRPQVDLGAEGVQKIVDSEGEWLPTERVPLPESEKGTAYIKKRRKTTEKLIEQGRAGNKGCYAISWVFLLALIAGGAFALKSCGVF